MMNYVPTWIPVDRLRTTLENTTQLYRQRQSDNILRQHFKTRFPAANVARTHETVASDTVWWPDGPPAIDDGITGHGGAIGFQLFAGHKTKHVFIMPVRSDEEYPKCLKEYIRKCGAPDKIWTDQAKAMTNSKQVQEILRMYHIDDGHSEPHYQNQNFAERHAQDIKRTTKTIMNATNTPAMWWLLAALYVTSLFNHLSTPTLGDRTPLELKFGQTPDVSKFMHFRWWEPVYYRDADNTEKLGRWAGIADHVGDELCWAIVTGETGQLIYRSDVRTATNPNRPNLRAEAILDLSSGEEYGQKQANENVFDPDSTIEESIKTRKFTPEELVGKYFLKEDKETGIVQRTKIVRKLENDENDRKKNIQFLLQIDKNETSVEDVMHYNDLCDIMEDQTNEINGVAEDKMWTFERIIGHQGPYKPNHPNYKGSAWNVLVDWDGYDATWEPRTIIEKTDPIAVAHYAKENNLLKKSGWKKYKRMARSIKKINTMLLRIFKAKKKRSQGPQFNYGVQLPDSKTSFQELDAQNKNTLWADAHKHEINKYNELVVFKDHGPFSHELLQKLKDEGYQHIRLIWVYDVKHDGRRRARLVAGGHTTWIRKGDSAYSSVVNLRTLRMALLLGELNGLKIMTADIVSAYLMAYTNEKIFFIAGPEFGELEGHIMTLNKAVYGLRTSGKRYHDLIYDTMKELGFKPSLADPDIYMRDAGDCYEYVCIYVDDLTLIMKEPEKLLAQIEEKGFKLKDVTTNPTVFLGGSVSRDEDGTLSWGAKRYIERSLQNLERIYGKKPIKKNVPLPENTHPEMDTSPLLDQNGIDEYQSLIGMLQWTVTLGRFDIACAVMTMSRFRTIPREGHLHLLKHIFGYLRKNPDGAIRFRTGIQNHEAHYEVIEREWEKMVYGDIKEEIPTNAPTPKGKSCRLSGWFDANLWHCFATGRSAMGQFIMVNQTPVFWSSKRQNTVETATYATEFIAGRALADEMIATRYELRMLGAPLDGPSWCFGDNESMINSSMLPEGRLMKRSIALSYHRVRECVSANILHFFHVDGKLNISDCLTKHLSHRILQGLIKPVLFWKGDTNDCGNINIHIDGKKYTLEPIKDSALEIGECQPLEIIPSFEDQFHFGSKTKTSLDHLGTEKNNTTGNFQTLLSQQGNGVSKSSLLPYKCNNVEILDAESGMVFEGYLWNDDETHIESELKYGK